MTINSVPCEVELTFMTFSLHFTELFIYIYSSIGSHKNADQCVDSSKGNLFLSVMCLQLDNLQITPKLGTHGVLLQSAPQRLQAQRVN